MNFIYTDLLRRDDSESNERRNDLYHRSHQGGQHRVTVTRTEFVCLGLRILVIHTDNSLKQYFIALCLVFILYCVTLYFINLCASIIVFFKKNKESKQGKFILILPYFRHVFS